jgi:hypothetical protein
MARRADVLPHEGPVQIRRELFEHLGVRPDQPEEGRAPRREGDRIDERESAVARPVQEVGTQRHASTEVVGNHAGVRQSPVFEEP